MISLKLPPQALKYFAASTSSIGLIYLSKKYPNDISTHNWMKEDPLGEVQKLVDFCEPDDTYDEEDGKLLDEMFSKPDYDPETDGTIDWSKPHSIDELKEIWAFRPLHKVPVETHEWLDKIKYSVANGDDDKDLYKWKLLEDYRDLITYDKNYREHVPK